MLCLAEPDTLCFPVTVTGTGVQVAVTPAGYYQAGYVCVPISGPAASTSKWWLPAPAYGGLLDPCRGYCRPAADDDVADSRRL